MNLYLVTYETVYSISNEEEYVVASSFDMAEKLIRDDKYKSLIVNIWSVELICSDIKIQEK